MNIANNSIEAEGVDSLVRSLQSNNALHALLLGGNPGFTTDSAFVAAEATAKTPLRLSLMPQGVAMLLKRWMTLQLKEKLNMKTESLGMLSTSISKRVAPGTPSKRTAANTSATGSARESINTLQSIADSHDDVSLGWKEMKEVQERHSHAPSSPVAYDSTPSRLTRQAREGSRNGEYQSTTQTPLSFARVSTPSNISRLIPSNSAPTPIPALYGEGFSQRMGPESVSRNFNGLEPASRNYDGAESAFRNYNGPESASRNYNGSGSTSRNDNGLSSLTMQNRYASHGNIGMKHIVPQVHKEFGTEEDWENEKNKERQRERERPLIKKVLQAWTSPAATEILGQHLRHLLDSSVGRYDRDTSQHKRSHSVSRVAQSNAEVRRQADICARLSMGMSVTDRYVPPIRAKPSPQRQRAISSFSNGLDGNPHSDHLMLYQEGGHAYSTVGQDTASTYGQLQPTILSDKSNIVKKKKKIRKKRKEEEQIEAQKNAFEGIVSHFSDTVRDISKSLGTVTEQLRDVTGSLSESVSVMNRSQMSISPNKSMTSASVNRTSNSFAAGFEPSPANERMKRTYGRSNGSTFSDADRIEVSVRDGRDEEKSKKSMGIVQDLPVYQLHSNGRYSGHEGGHSNRPSGGDSPIRSRDSQTEIDISTERGKLRHTNYNSNTNENIQNHALRKTQTVPKANPPTPTYFTHIDNSGIAFNERNILNQREISEVEMASLIRERLKKKLESVLRPPSS